ncbi:MAG: PQQ-like beta-propeller repeat protein [Candidatus Eiseniibacteriota bacterium]|nr:MAG: PQQ-like beta-propeller repeat protein [Candidatus Eisenbacteria bacterium]
MEQGRVSVKTFGRPGQETGALLFVETGRGTMPDEAFLLVSDVTRAGRRLFSEGLAEYKRGSRIRTPGQYVEFMQRVASRPAPSEEAPGAAVPSFLVAWLRGDTRTWARAGDYSLLAVSPSGNFEEPGESSGTAGTEPGDRLVVGRRATLARLRERVSSGHGPGAAPGGVTESARQAGGSSESESPALATAVCEGTQDEAPNVSEGNVESLLSSLSREPDSGPLLLIVREAPLDTEQGKRISSPARGRLAPTPASAAGRAGPDSASTAFRGLREASKAALRSPAKRGWPLPMAGVAVAVVVVALVWAALREAGPPRVEDISDAPEPVAVTMAPPSAPEGGRETGTATPTSINFSSKWKRTFRGAVTSSPTVAGGKVYFGCRDGYLYCLDAETGEQEWKFPAGAGIGSSPLVSNGKVLVGSYNGRFWSVDAASGAKNWEFRTGGKIVSSPIVSSGSVLFGSYDKNLYCLSERDGKLLWKHPSAGVVWSSPSVSRGRVFFGSADGAFYCVSLESGQQHWKKVLPGGIYSSPAVQDRAVCFGTTAKTFHFLDVADGRELFKVDAGGEVRASPLIVDGTAYVAADDGLVRAISVDKGGVSWTFKTGREVRSRPCFSDDLLFVTSYDGKLYALSPSSGEKMGSFNAGAQLYSSPFVWEQKVYFGSNTGEFHCVQRVSPSP